MNCTHAHEKRGQDCNRAGTPIATYRDGRGRLRLVVDKGPEAGVYHAGGGWLAMRPDVTVRLLESWAPGTVRLFLLDPCGRGAGGAAGTEYGWRRSQIGGTA